MIQEVIITTTGSDGQPHIAPFGVRYVAEQVLIAPFRPSASLDNLLRERVAVMNVTDDVRIFAGALTGRREWPVVAAQHVRGWVLQAALSHLELVLERVEEDAVRPQLFFRVAHQVMHAPAPGFNRAQAAVIEAAVLVSRLHLLPAEKIETELCYLKIAVEKTAGEREWQAWQWLVEKIEQHMKTHRE